MLMRDRVLERGERQGSEASRNRVDKVLTW